MCGLKGILENGLVPVAGTASESTMPREASAAGRLCSNGVLGNYYGLVLGSCAGEVQTRLAQAAQKPKAIQIASD
jgi:hypothetical protein